MKILDPTSYLFHSFPREALVTFTNKDGKPMRTRDLIRTQREFKRYLAVSNGVQDACVSVYDVASFTVDKVIFDFDGPHAYNEFVKTCQFVEDMGWTWIPVKSGMKGYHLYVPVKPIPNKSLPEKRSLIKNTQQYILSEALGTSSRSMDPTVVGDIRQMIRVPGSMRVGMGRFCAYLPHRFFETHTEKDLEDYSIHPRSFSYPITTIVNAETLPKVETQVIESSRRKSFQSIIDPEPVDLPLEDKTVKLVLESSLRPCLAWAISQPNPPHWVRVAATIDLLQFYDVDFVVRLYSMLGWVDFDKEMTAYQVNNIKSKEFKSFSCKKIKSLIQKRGVCKCTTTK